MGGDEPQGEGRKVKPARPGRLGYFVSLTLFFGVLPFAVYLIERATGALPGPSDWQARSIDHGPWRWEPEGFTIAYPMLVLVAATLIVGVLPALLRREFAVLWRWLLLGAVQIGAGAAQAHVLAWTLD
jgi:hypothetical protein